MNRSSHRRHSFAIHAIGTEQCIRFSRRSFIRHCTLDSTHYCCYCYIAIEINGVRQWADISRTCACLKQKWIIAMGHHKRDESAESTWSEQSIRGIENFIEQLCFAPHLYHTILTDRSIIIAGVAAIAELRVITHKHSPPHGIQLLDTMEKSFASFASNAPLSPNATATVNKIMKISMDSMSGNFHREKSIMFSGTAT